ncbi:MAG: hypothetical protein E7433_01255 [Ruminococcaceae bacterium]|nr:hypothetical protein [Oscillospiraceae bacterium]
MKRDNWVAFVPFYLIVVLICIIAAGGGSSAVDVVSQNIPVERQHRIVIDAGHGGVDGGATSCTGVLESQINLEIALRLDDLMHLLGYDTVMIRKTDTSIYTQGQTIAAQKVSDLKERVRIVNQTENAILISIHQNTFSDSRYGGAQVFYAKDEDSRKLANQMQNDLIRYLNPESRRKPKKASGVYLMDHIDHTGVLVECGFISNPEEEAKLQNDAYQKKLCCVIVSSLSQVINA